MIPAVNADLREFYCPRWPGCQCPDGTVAIDCPGRTVDASIWVNMNRFHGGYSFGTGAIDCPGRSLPASSGDGGPARAPESQASPAARSIDPDGAVATFRAAKAETEARRRRAISGESLIADINAALGRCDKAVLELSAIQCELAMVRKDMGELFGLPVEPAARKAT